MKFVDKGRFEQNDNHEPVLDLIHRKFEVAHLNTGTSFQFMVFEILNLEKVFWG